MECLRYCAHQTSSYPLTELQFEQPLTKRLAFNAELCGIWLGKLPFNQHLGETIFPSHVTCDASNTQQFNVHPVYLHTNTTHGAPTTTLPQRSTRKTSSSLHVGSKVVSSASLHKTTSPELPTRMLTGPNRPHMQLEACRIPGVLICSKGRLVFSSKDVHLKLPTHLGGPGGSDILSLSAQKTSQHSYLECMLTCDPLNSGTIPDLSYWPVGNRSNFSCQSLLSTHENRKLCIGETSPSSLRKRGLKQFLTTLLSKKPKQNRNPFEGVSTGCSSGQADVAARGLSATYHHVSTATAGDTKDGAETLRLDWPLTTLRQFAFRGCLFKMETGRRAPHGEGHYLFRVKDIGEFRQTLEAHIKSHKRTRALKTLSAVCYPAPCRLFPPSIPPPPPPPPPTAPPPPPASVTDSQAYVNLPPLPQPLSRSWSHLVESSEEETARVLAEEPLIHHEDDDDDVEWQVGCLPPPPPPGADLIPATNDLVPVTPSSTPQGRVIRVGTYENVRTLLQSNGDLPRSPSRSAVESCLELHTPNEASTINYALLEFQPPAASPPHSGQSSVQNVAAVGVLVPSSNRSVLTRTSSVRSRPRPSRLLVRSVGDGLNTLASSATAAVPPGVTTSGQAAANYVDICPLQTLAINELLRTTL